MLQTKEKTISKNVHHVEIWRGLEHVCTGLGQTIENARQTAWDGYAIMKKKGEL